MIHLKRFKYGLAMLGFLVAIPLSIIGWGLFMMSYPLITGTITIAVVAYLLGSCLEHAP